PLELHPAYYYDPATATADVAIGVAAVLGFLLLVALSWRRSRAALTCFVLAALWYAPYAQLMFIPRLAADTYTYLPGLFFLIASTALLTSGRRPGSPDRSTRTAGLLFVVLILALAARTTSQAGRWADGASLWASVAERYPGAAAP